MPSKNIEAFKGASCFRWDSTKRQWRNHRSTLASSSRMKPKNIMWSSICTISSACKALNYRKGEGRYFTELSQRHSQTEQIQIQLEESQRKRWPCCGIMIICKSSERMTVRRRVSFRCQDILRIHSKLSTKSWMPWLRATRLVQKKSISSSFRKEMLWKWSKNSKMPKNSINQFLKEIIKQLHLLICSNCM